jgi:hypothetical protein
MKKNAGKLRAGCGQALREGAQDGRDDNVTQAERRKKTAASMRGCSF